MTGAESTAEGPSGGPRFVTPSLQERAAGPQWSGPPPRHSIHATRATSSGAISRPARRRDSATPSRSNARPRISPSTRTRRPPVGPYRPAFADEPSRASGVCVLVVVAGAAVAAASRSTRLRGCSWWSSWASLPCTGRRGVCPIRAPLPRAPLGGVYAAHSGEIERIQEGPGEGFDDLAPGPRGDRPGLTQQAPG